MALSLDDHYFWLHRLLKLFFFNHRRRWWRTHKIDRFMGHLSRWGCHSRGYVACRRAALTCHRQQLLSQVFGGDLVERTRRDLCRGDAKLLRLLEHKSALKVQVFGDFINSNGHDLVLRQFLNGDWRLRHRGFSSRVNAPVRQAKGCQKPAGEAFHLGQLPKLFGQRLQFQETTPNPLLLRPIDLPHRGNLPSPVSGHAPR